MDTNVLLPMNLRDVLLVGAFGGLYQVCWSAETLDAELRRNLVKPEFGLTNERAEELISALKRAFPAATIIVDQEMRSEMQNDPKDRHVTAAAVQAQAKTIVTINRKDFRWRPPGVDVLHPDEFLSDLMDTYADQMFKLIRRRVTRFQRPKIGLAEFVGRLGAQTPNFSARMLAEMTERSLD